MARKSAADSAQSAPAPSQIAEAWKARLPQTIAVVGQENALREEALRGIRKAAFADGDGGMSWVVLHAAKAAGEAEALSAAAVLDEVRTRPMFGAPDEPKVVVVRGAEALFATAESREVFERHLGKLPEGAVLVFEVPDPGRLKSTRLFKEIEKAGALVDCKPLRNEWGREGPDSNLAQELERRAAELGLQLDPRATMALMERSGHTLGVLEEELAKLSLALGAGNKKVAVGEEQVKAICADSRLVGAFEFADAVGEGDLKRSWETLGAIFSHGLGDHRKPGRVVTGESEIAIRLLAALTYKIAQLQDLRAALDSGQREFDVYKAFKLFYERRDQAQRSMRRFDAAGLRRAVEALFRANIDLRTGHDRRARLERLALEICRG